MVEPCKDLADELTPPGSFAARYGVVAVLTGRKATLHLGPRLTKHRTNSLGADRSAEKAEVGRVDLGRCRIAPKQGAPDIE